MLVDIARLFSTVPVAWALLDQVSSSWVLQARDMDRTIAGVTIPAGQLQGLNPLFDIPIIFTFQSLVFPWLTKHAVKVTLLRRMAAGMGCASVSFVMVAIIQAVMDAGARPSVLWQIPAYVFISMGEILVAVSGLELAYTQAPPGMKSTVLACWLLTLFAGNGLTAVVAALNWLQGASWFVFFAALQLVAGLLFIWIASTYEMRHLSDESRRPAKRHVSDEAADMHAIAQWQDHAPASIELR